MKVEYVDHMGSDLHVVNAARVSFDKESEWDFTYDRETGDIEYPLKEKDQKLIKYLATHNHWTPFGHPQITLREKVPIFVARQRFKHTVGFVYNEVSRRYVDSEPEFYVPDVWRKRAEDKKQGSSEETIMYLKGSPGMRVSHKYTATEEYTNTIDHCVSLYEDMIDAGVCPEQARMVLPQSMYTEYIVTGSLAAFARAYNLRSDSHAQVEIQVLAKEWDRVIRPLFPHSWSALVEQ